MASNELIGKTLTVRQLFTGHKYSLAYYQREYAWTKAEVAELMDDLTSRFLNEYSEDHERTQVGNYNNYFLGPIVTSQANGSRFLVDGQQRLTTLTLLLMHLHHLSENKDGADLKPLIRSEKYGKYTFNINVPEREEVMTAILKKKDFDTNKKSSSVSKIYHRFNDIVDEFPEKLMDKPLPYFIDWLLERVLLVEISTSDQSMALEIFETMNDRGLSLSSTDMLKSFLLSKASDPLYIKEANERWRKRIAELVGLDKDTESEFFKVWLRSKYADSIRARKRNAKQGDFDIIGTAFHRWVRDNRKKIGLYHPNDYQNFINKDFEKMSIRYMQLIKASNIITPGLEHVFYNSKIGVTLQYLPIMAAVTPDDDEQTFHTKTRLVASYLNIFIARRMVNYNNFGYSTIVYNIFNLAKGIRNLESHQISEILMDRVSGLPSFNRINYFGLHMRNGWNIRYLLARMISWIEEECGRENRFFEYVERNRKDPYEVEHIWANFFERYEDAFQDKYDFARHRNRFGGLLLLPKSFNASFGAKPYEEKLDHYRAQTNLLAQSFHPLTYKHNPRFRDFIARTGLPFKPYPDGFSKHDMGERQDLYRQICERVWDPDRLLAVE